jgi:hypothetical protein
MSCSIDLLLPQAGTRGRGLKLVIANVSKFLRVDGLSVEDWSG